MKYNIYKELLNNIENQIDTVLMTRYNTSTNKIEKNIFTKEELDKKEVAYIEQLDKNQTIKNINISNDESLLIEKFKRGSRLIVFGAGHIGYYVSIFASQVGFDVTVVDDRPYFANTQKFKENINVICMNFKDALQYLNISEDDYVVIVTRGHKHDKLCLENILNLNDLAYLGMIGSKRRVKIMKEELLEEGYDKDKLDKIYTPIGLNIGAVTPEEISISILAELISIKRIGKIATKNETVKVNNSSEINRDVIEVLSNNKENKMSLVTIISTKGSTPRKAGSKMVVFDSGHVVGTIGGGCAEANIIGIAARMSGSNEFKIKSIDMTGKVAEDEGMVCGGIMTVLIEGINFD